MAIAVADLAHLADSSVAAPNKPIGVVVVHEQPLFRVGLCSFLGQQGDCRLIGAATRLEEVLLLVREQHPDVVLLDGSLTSTDPLNLVQQLRLLGVPGILVFAPSMGDEETLFRFLMHGATAYEDGSISGAELLAKMHRVALGECLVTGDVLAVQAARRQRLAQLRRDALLAARLAEAPLPARQGGNGKSSACEDDDLLTSRQREILEQVARGQTNAQVAQALGISPHTVKNNLNDMYRKLRVSDRTSAVVRGLRTQWLAVGGAHALSL